MIWVRNLRNDTNYCNGMSHILLTSLWMIRHTKCWYDTNCSNDMSHKLLVWVSEWYRVTNYFGARVVYSYAYSFMEYRVENLSRPAARSWDETCTIHRVDCRLQARAARPRAPFQRPPKRCLLLWFPAMSRYRVHTYMYTRFHVHMYTCTAIMK